MRFDFIERFGELLRVRRWLMHSIYSGAYLNVRRDPRALVSRPLVAGHNLSLKNHLGCYLSGIEYLRFLSFFGEALKERVVVCQEVQGEY